MVYINRNLFPNDNGSIMVYDNSHNFHHKHYFGQITEFDELKKSPSSLNQDLELLSKYQLIDILKEPNAGHGIRKVIRPLYSNEEIEFRATL